MSQPSIRYRALQSPLGELLIAATNDGLCRIGWDVPEPEFISDLEERWNRPAHRDSTPSNGVPTKAARQLAEYFAGQRRDFDLPLDLSSIRLFQRTVLQALLEVPYGEVVSYGELAMLAGCRGAARAVGGAMRGNPLPIVIPCHRVIRHSGAGRRSSSRRPPPDCIPDSTLGGFGGRPDLKRWLLTLEGWRTGNPE